MLKIKEEAIVQDRKNAYENEMSISRCSLVKETEKSLFLIRKSEFFFLVRRFFRA
jgi:hypothetical protein